MRKEIAVSYEAFVLTMLRRLVEYLLEKRIIKRQIVLLQIRFDVFRHLPTYWFTAFFIHIVIKELFPIANDITQEVDFVRFERRTLDTGLRSRTLLRFRFWRWHILRSTLQRHFVRGGRRCREVGRRFRDVGNLLRGQFRRINIVIHRIVSECRDIRPRRLALRLFALRFPLRKTYLVHGIQQDLLVNLHRTATFPDIDRASYGVRDNGDS